MESGQEKRLSGTAALTIAFGVLICLLPVLYALSIGPAFLVGLDPDTHNFIYGPLDSVAAAWPPLNDLLNGYADLWR